SREIEILSFFGAYFIALREDTQQSSMGNFGEIKPRKGQNQDETRQKRETWRSREKSKAVTVEKERAKFEITSKLKKTKKRTKIESKPDKNGKRVEARKSLKQLL
nr:hypothetical protein [Tanacetum cinerariifolium]